MLRLTVFAPSPVVPPSPTIVPLSRPSSSPAPAATEPVEVPPPRLPSSPSSASSVPTPSIAETFEAQLSAGKKALEDRNHDEAIRRLQRATELSPDDPQALQWLATALQAAERYDETISVYRKLLALQPDDRTAGFNLALALGRKGDLYEAERVYWDLLERFPNFTEARMNLATLCQVQGRLGEARRQWRKVLGYRPESVTAHEALGEILTDLGRFDEAMEAYAQAATLQAGVASAWLNYAASAIAAGSAGRAAAALDKALHLAPYDAEAWSLRGDVLREMYRTTDNREFLRRAIEAWTKSLEIDPDQPALRDLLRTYNRASTSAG